MNLDLGGVVLQQLVYLQKSILLILVEVIEPFDLAIRGDSEHEKTPFKIAVRKGRDSRGDLFAN